MKIVREESRNFVGVLLQATSVVLLTVAVTAQIKPPSDPSLSGQLHRALHLIQRGDQQGAMELTLKLLEQNPKFAPALKLKGMLLEESGQNAQAAAAYEEALKFAPDDPDLLLKSGIYKLAAGDRDEALKRLQHCTRITPRDGDAQFYLAQAYHVKGQDKSALVAIRQSLKAEPENPSVWQKFGELLCATEDCQTGLSWLIKAQRGDPKLAHIDFDIALSNYKLMDLPGAAQYAQHAVADRSDDLEALQLLATVDVKLARWGEAKTAFEQLQALRADDVETLLGLGQCELELNNFPTAIARLTSVLRIDPTRLQAHFYLSRAYAGLGRTADAQHEAALHQLMMQQLTFARSLENEQREGEIKAKVEQLLSANREDIALRIYQEHFKGTSATTADAYVFIGKLELLMGKMDEGLRNLHQALKIQPTVRGARTQEGILALKLGELNRAEKEFQAELAIDPNYQLAIAEMGEVRYHQQRWSEAADFLAKSKTITPELLYMLCDSYFRLGKVEDADLNAEAMAAYARNRPEIMHGLVELLVRNGQSDLANRLRSAGTSH
jgi:tetratricopeptide (TPR) repeat protein